ncbi:hypothetical protein CAL7716_029200 [Calothrix sp. PCC 7716]|nr:hypothetical protein CAL7716_029200 [Calothrix sp. PCC 7716]
MNNKKNEISIRRSGLSPAKQAILEKRLRGECKSDNQQKFIPRRSQQNPVPLSFAQQRLWFLAQLEPDSPFYNVPGVVHLQGKLNFKALQDSLQEIINRHEALRCNFKIIEDKPVAFIFPTKSLLFPVFDISELTASQQAAEIQKLAYQEAQQPFDLSSDLLLRVKLLRLNTEEHILLFTMHHIVSDGWSIGVLVRELATLYQAFCDGLLSPLFELPIQYGDFAIWQQEYLQGEVLRLQKTYWKQQLGGSLPVLQLPTDYPRPAVQSYKGKKYCFTVSKSLTTALKTLSQQAEATLFMTLLAAFKTLIYRYIKEDDIIIGTAIANRNLPQIEKLIGFFVNTLVLRTDVSGNPSFLDLLGRVREVTLDAYNHQDLPFDKLVEEIQPERNLSHNPLFQVWFALNNSPMPSLEIGGLTLTISEVDSATAQFDLSLDMVEQQEELIGTFEYNSDLFDADTITRIAEHFQTLLAGIVANPDRCLSDLPILTEAQKHLLQVEFCQNQSQIIKLQIHQCLHQLFEEQVKQTPFAMAVVCKQEQLNYQELNQRANKLAHYLLMQGLQPEQLVGLYIEKSPWAIAAILGILKAGGAYLPLDSTYPQERLALMLKDAQISLLLTQEKLLTKLPKYPVKVVCLDTDWQDIARESTENPICQVSDDNLAYVLYTSGSTGQPKGVCCHHRGVTNLLADIESRRSLAVGTRCSLWTNLTFDVSVYEIFSAFLSGGMLHIVPEDIRADATALIEWLSDHQIQSAFLPPFCLNTLGDWVARTPENCCLQRLLVGVEPISEQLLLSISHSIPGLQIINGYGPTEATICATLYSVKSKFACERNTPIGRPVQNTEIYILDSYLQLVPVGIPGEIYIGGVGLAQGYLNRPDLTKEKFILWNGEKRLYKTGDKAKYLADGNIEFLGRLDYQIKLRGFRIELGEIEAVIKQHPYVGEAAVIAREDVPGDKRLVAYVVEKFQRNQTNQQQLPAQLQTDLESEYLSQLENIYDQFYSWEFSPIDASINLRVWTSRYTNQPLPEVEILECVRNTVERVLALKPNHILEIGCGTGLLLLKIAPHCQHYCGLDISDVALHYLQQQIDLKPEITDKVTLLQGMAHELPGIEPSKFDTVILNEIIQNFPSVNYLAQVLTNLVEVVKPGGRIFIGGVRSLPLLETFHAWVQLHQASGELSTAEFRQRVQENLQIDNELVIDPGFFKALQQSLPKISYVQIQLKGGRHHNELTKFKYDVIIYVDAEINQSINMSWLDWQKLGLSVNAIRQLLLEKQPEILGITRIPNARLVAEVRLLELLNTDKQLHTVAALQEALLLGETDSVDPEELWALGNELPYFVNISWSCSGVDGDYDLVFIRQNSDGQMPQIAIPSLTRETISIKPWNYYANAPLQKNQQRQLALDLRQFLEQKLPNYMIPAAFVALEALPLTPNGKLDRRALPEPEATQLLSESDFIAPSTAIEEMLVNIWTEVLGIENIGIHHNFFSLGGHSLLATRVVSQIRQVFQIELPLRRIFEEPTIAGLAKDIEKATEANLGVEAKSIERIARSQNLPLSFAQQRLWFLAQLEPHSSFYNMPGAVRLQGQLNVEALQQSINEILRRHEALRTNFQTIEGQTVAVILPAAPVLLPILDISELPVSQQELQVKQQALEEAQQPFDLNGGFLLRVKLLRLGEQEHVVLLTMHHIACDGWSTDILVREFATLYQAFYDEQPAPLAELPIQYVDFAAWQRQWLQGERIESQISYWRKQLEGISKLLELPTDFSRPPVQTFRGATYSFKLCQQLSVALNHLSQQQETTLFMTLLAAFQVLLYRYTGIEDIAIGSPIGNRNRAEIEGLIGLFVNTLVLRTNLAGNPTFEELLAGVRSVALSAYAHQDLPFEVLVEELQPQRNLSHTPLFQVMFVLQNAPMSALELPGLTISYLPIDNGTAKFDLTLHMTETVEGLSGAFEYNTDLFQESTIKRIAGHLQTLLEGIAANPQQRLSELTLLTESEQHQLLLKWNNTKVGYPQQKCIHELFEVQVERTPDAVAVVYENQQLTYRKLNARANQLAHYLRSLGVKPEVLVGICVERSLDMVIGLLAILKAGGAYLPLDPSYPTKRLAYMLEDSQPGVLLTQQYLLESLPNHKAQVICVDSDWELIADESTENPASSITVDNLAYVIYTSGSTGKPKGAMNTHSAISNRLLWMQDTYQLTSADTVLQKTPFSFDVSVWEFFFPLMTGARLVVAQPEGHRDTDYLVNLILQQQITTLHFVPSMLQVFIEAEGLEKCQSLVRVIASGEALSAQLQQRFFNRLDAQLYNLYGPTETAVDVTFWQCKKDSVTNQNTVPIGRPIANIQIYLLDNYLNPVPMGVMGEVYIGGVGVGRGYLNRPDLTAEKFIPNPFSKQTERLYKTGDKARYLPNGDIEYLGRIDNQVKLRGFRIELGEIEATISQYPGVRETVVIVSEESVDSQRIVAYVVPQKEQTLEIRELRTFLEAKLPSYMVPAVFVILEALPLTPNGKIDRKALPSLELTQVSSSNITLPSTPIENLLAGIWAEVLGIDKAGIDNNFFELGGHSLIATRVISQIRQVFQVELPLRYLFEKPTIAGLAKEIEKAIKVDSGVEATSIKRITRSQQLPLSFAQQRLWFLAQLEPDSPFYNIPAAVRLQGLLNIEALQQSFNSIVRRHEALRTNFQTREGQAVVIISQENPLTLSIFDISDLPQNQQEAEIKQQAAQEAQQPFDISSDLLLRVKLLRLGEQEHIVLLTMHHIVSDGWSIGVLVEELATLYQVFCNGQPSPLPPLSIQYVDFAAWQRQWLQGQALETQLSYWLKQLENAPKVLELPTDHPRPAIQTFRGATYSFELSKELSVALNKLSQQQGTTLFMTLLAGFQILLWRYTGQNDIVVGSPIANRNRAEIEGLIGFFVNTLVLRTNLVGNPSFEELLKRVREVALGAYAHQDLPFELLIEQLQPQRNLSHTPLFQVMFVLQNALRSALELPGLTLSPLESDSGTAQFDLTLSMTETESGLVGSFEYNTDLFAQSSIQRMAGHLQTLFKSIVTNPRQRLSDLRLLTELEQHQLLWEWNGAEVEYPQQLCIHELFEAQVEKTPDAIAVVFESKQLTYRELNARANQLAHYLHKLGVKPEVLVGICVERSLLMVIGLLAILKAGGAYVPVDHSYPTERIAFILEDTQAPVLLTQASLVEAMPQHQAIVVCLDTDWHLIAQQSQENVFSQLTTDNLAYVIYTSGSTGKPKGVQIPHTAVSNFLYSMKEAPGLTSEDTLLAVTTYSFDIAALELFLPIIVGARLIVASREIVSDGTQLSAKLIDSKATVMQATPATWQLLLAAGWSGNHQLKILCGGEALPGQLANQLLDRCDCLWNMYGPTETTIWSAANRVKTVNNSVPISSPIANTQLYILDKYHQLVPVGVAGELCIAGEGLARGYFHRPDLTAEKFIPNPFSDKSTRLYKTGDLARYLPNGDIEYIGRIDNQVKVRGFRIELGEIEAIISQYPGVRETVVVVREDSASQRIAAYLVPQKEQALTIPEVRSFLQSKLPNYMVPSVFIILEALPLTPNGKVDRKALPAPNTARPQLDQKLVKPRNFVETKLTEIFTEVLGVDKVSIFDNFFELGGDSIVAIVVITKANQAGLQLTVKQLFQHQTVADLAAVAVTKKVSQAEQKVIKNDTPSNFPKANLNQQDLDQFLAKVKRGSKNKII